MNGKRILVSAIAILCALALAFSPCPAQKKKGGKGAGKGKGKAKAGAARINTLTEPEKAEGWQLLFDGNSFAGWHGLNKPDTEIPMNFKIEDGAIHKVAGKPAGDLATIKGWDNFEFSFDWKLAEGGNNGVKYNVSPALSKGTSSLGFEYQVLDDKKASDNKIDNHACGSLYELVAPDPAQKQVMPIGEWNQSKIVYNANHIEHWLNGKKLLEAEVGSPAFNEALAKSKWNKIAAEFGKRRTDGVIVITDHNDECWYRNLKIRELKP
jgi:hypothetical protein